MVQAFMAAYLAFSRHFLLHTETEPSAGEREGMPLACKKLSKGFADICLEPMTSHHPELRHGYLIEVKYLKRSEDTSGASMQAAVQEAEGQLRRYLADERLERQYLSVEFSGLVVFHGWEMVVCDAIAPRAGHGTV